MKTLLILGFLALGASNAFAKGWKCDNDSGSSVEITLLENGHGTANAHWGSNGSFQNLEIEEKIDTEETGHYYYRGKGQGGKFYLMIAPPSVRAPGDKLWSELTASQVGAPFVNEEYIYCEPLNPNGSRSRY